MKKEKIFLNNDDINLRFNEQIRELEKKLSDKDRVLESYKNEHGKLEIFFRQVREQISPISPIEISYEKNEKVHGSKCVIVAQISDTHLGEVQESEEIEGFNKYNVDICRERCLRYMKNLIEWTNLHRHAYIIDEIALLVTGDLISGDIHDELQKTAAFPAPVQSVESGKLLAQQITMLIPYFKKITVHFIVEDNHGRLTRKPQAKEAGYNTYNYIVGEIAKIYLKEQKSVEFNIYPQLEKVVNVNNTRYLICHGHNMRGWMGIPWYGIHRQVSKESMKRMSEIMKDQNRAHDIGFHKYVMGHWHTPFDFPLYSGCGSVSGTSAYDHREGRHSEPSQSAWICHPKWGEFNRINFRLSL